MAAMLGIATTQRLSRNVRPAEEPGRRCRLGTKGGPADLGGGAARSGGYGCPVVGAAVGKDGSAAGRADAADGLEAGPAELQDCILVVLLRTPAATSRSARCTQGLGLVPPHLPYCGAGGRCVARPGRAWR